jgi:hypothetical protein
MYQLGRLDSTKERRRAVILSGRGFFVASFTGALFPVDPPRGENERFLQPNQLRQFACSLDTIEPRPVVFL